MPVSCNLFSAFHDIGRMLRRMGLRKRKSSGEKKLVLEEGERRCEGVDQQGEAESLGTENDVLPWRLSPPTELELDPDSGIRVIDPTPHTPPPPPVHTEIYYHPQLEAEWIDLGGPVDVDVAKRCNRVKCPGMPFDPVPPRKPLPRLGPHHGTMSHILRTTLVTQACITHNASLNGRGKSHGVAVYASPQKAGVTA